jgi:hypothetical protein
MNIALEHGCEEVQVNHIAAVWVTDAANQHRKWHIHQVDQ